MAINIWNLLKNDFEEFPQIKCLNSDDEQILKAEREIGLNFSESYKYFLKNYQCNSVGELEIYTINKSKSSCSELWSIKDNDKFFKQTQKWPDIEDWYIVSTDGSGDPIGINPKGEVWISYHDSGFEQEKLADSFEEFLYKLLTKTLWE